MDEYFSDSLFDALIYCIVKGFDSNEIMSLSIGSFGRLYASLKRIAAYETMELSSCLRVSANAKEKDYKKYIAGVSRWLHKVEQGTKFKKTQGVSMGMSDFERDFRGQIHDR